MKKITCTFSLMFFSIQLFAQIAIVRGKVVKQSTNEPIPYVNITAAKNGIQSDFNGEYQLNLTEGKHTLKFSFIGFETQQIEVTLVENQIQELNISLVEQEELLQTVVVSGSKYERRLSEETVSIEVIRPSIIENSNSAQMDEALEKVPGVSVVDDQANIRGGSGYSYGAGSRVLLLVDDMPILTSDSGSPAWDFIPLENVQQVEVVKGASSALYGSSALNGIINIRTAYPTAKPYTKISIFNTLYQKPADNKIIAANGEVTEKAWWGNKAPYELGATFTHRRKIGQFDLVGGAYLYKQKSWRKEEFIERYRINLNTRYRFKNTPNLSIGLNFNAQKTESATFFLWNGSGAEAYLPWNTLETPLNDRKNFSMDPYAEYFNPKKNIRTKLQGRYYYVDNQNQTDQSKTVHNYYGEWQFQKKYPTADFSYTLGLVGSAVNTTAELYDGFFQSSNLSAYVQLDKKLFDRLNIALGGRYERNKLQGKKEAKPVGRLGLNYQLAEGTFLRASYGEGYRFPTIAEKFVSTSLDDRGLITVSPNLELESETGWSAELGIKQGFKLGDWQGYADLAGFINEYQNMMEFTFNYWEDLQALAFRSVNIGDTQITGIDASIAGKGKMGKAEVNVLAGYTYINPRLETPLDSIPAGSWPAGPNIEYGDGTNALLKYRFRHSFKTDIQTDYNKISAGISLRHNSSIEGIDSIFHFIIPDLQKYRTEHDKGVWLMDTRIGYEIIKGGTLSFICRNLFNKEYAIRPALIEAPRSFTFRFSQEL
ncbi:MAG: TonB-dependent receptor [Chitinophagales bacterium]